MSTVTALAAALQHTITLAGHDGWGPNHGDGPGWWVIFPLTWLLIVATVVTLVVVSARRRGRLSGQRAGERRLAERYAAGEIDEQEYRARLATLRQIDGS